MTGVNIYKKGSIASRLIIYIIIMVMPVTGFAQVNADFSFSMFSPCAPRIVSFQDQSTGNVNKWLWNFGDGPNFVSDQNPQHLYTSAGTYPVTLIALDTLTGASDTIIKSVQLFNRPIAEYTGGPVFGCFPHDITLQDASIPGDAPLVDWVWDMGDGTFMNGPVVNYTYDSIRCYKITLIVTDSNGCSHFITKNPYVCVEDKPQAAFTFSPSGGCAPTTVTFTNTSTGIGTMTSTWYIPGVDTVSTTSGSASVVFNNPGVYNNIFFIVTDSTNCSDTLIYTNANITISTCSLDFTSNNLLACTTQPVCFQSLATPAGNVITYFWDFGDGNTASSSFSGSVCHVYSNPGVYTVTHTVLWQNGSGGYQQSVTKTAYITVIPPPQAAFYSPDTVGCDIPHTAQFYNQSTGTGLSYLWNFGDGLSGPLNTSTDENPVHTYANNPGIFAVSLTVTDTAGCTDVAVDSTYIWIVHPVAQFGIQPATSGCLPFEATFIENSSSITPITSWWWDFGDGTFSTLQNPPPHLYDDTVGAYKVCLAIETTIGCRDTGCFILLIGDTLNQSDFVSEDTFQCLEQRVCFTDSSFIDTSCNAVQWFWDFGDGGRSFSQNPCHVYTDTGYFDVMLITYCNGCPDTIIKEDYIYIAPPRADFIYSFFGCVAPHDVAFIDRSIGANAWLWDFGDGNTSTDQNPIHTYTDGGFYIITLTAYDTTTGCEHQKVDSLELIVPDAVEQIGPVFGCIPHTVNMSNNSPYAYTSQWYVDGALYSTSQNTSITFTTNGSHTIYLINCDSLGCCDTSDVTTTLTRGPVALFTADSTVGCPCLHVNFTSLSYSNGAPIVRHYWDFGDGHTSVAVNTDNTYCFRGNYTVSLTVTDSVGCSNTYTVPDFVQVKKPVPAFSMISNVFCTQQDIQFINNTVGDSTFFVWDFGDGSPPDSSFNPIHTYQNNGTYVITLNAYNVWGCDSTIKDTITLINPFVDIAASDTFGNCPPLVVNFTDTINYASPVVERFWDFGDGVISNRPNPQHVYTDPGVYDVTYIVTFANGCRDTIILQDYITVLGPNGQIIPDTTSGCPPLTICFTIITIDAVECIFEPEPNVFLPCDTSCQSSLCDTSIVCYTYNEIGLYVPAALLTDSAGCDYLLFSRDTLQIDTPTAIFNIIPEYGCQPQQVTFIDSSQGAVSWEWDFGDGSPVSNDTSPVHWYDTSGTFTVTLTVTNELGCRNTMRRSLTIYPPPNAHFTVDDSFGCPPLLVNFTDLSTPSDSAPIAGWWWSFGDGDTAVVQHPSHLYGTEDGGFNTAMLVVFDTLGCTDTFSRIIDVWQTPIILNRDTTICQGDTVYLRSLYADSVLQWSPPDWLSCTNCPNPVAIPQDTITYFLYGISLQGCENTDSILINVLPLPPVVASPDTAICYGDSVMLYAAGGTSVEWQPHIGLDNPFSYTPMASPPYTITYRVIVTDTNGCSSIDSVTVIVNRSIARFNEPRACIGDTVYFVDSSIVIGGNIIRWEWDFGDGDTSTEQNPAHYYNAIGYYNVTLTVYDDNGCQDDTTVVVHVSPLPLPDFIVPDPVCEDAPAQFADNSWSAAGLLSWWWDFGDGTYDSVENPVHIYTDTGFYTITMTVTDSNLCENSTSKTVYVRLRSFPNFEAENVCFHDTVYFRDISVSVPGIESWYWDFGDGQSDTVINPWHYYSAPGTYPATLTITDSFGCAYDTTIPVTVYQLPAADFIAPRTCLGNTTQFMDITTPGDANLVDWQWSFGDSAMAAIQNPVHLYSDSGIYLVQLIVTDANTCKDTIVKALIIDHPPDAFAGPDTIVCSGNSIQLYGGGGDTVYWTPQQWLTDPTIRNPIATPEFSINYTLHTTNGVCPYDTAIVHLTVIQIPFVKTIDDTRILQGTPVELTTFASPYDSIVWYAFINDTLVTADSLLWLSCTHCLSPTAYPEDSITYYVQTFDEYGCYNIDEVHISIYQRCDEDQIFVPNAFTPNGDGIHDKLYVRLYGMADINYFRIYDRWGNEVFSTTDINEPWTGVNKKGKKLNSAVYVYVVEAVCYSGETVIKKGNVTIIK